MNTCTSSPSLACCPWAQPACQYFTAFVNPRNKFISVIFLGRLFQSLFPWYIGDLRVHGWLLTSYGSWLVMKCAVVLWDLKQIWLTAPRVCVYVEGFVWGWRGESRNMPWGKRMTMCAWGNKALHLRRSFTLWWLIHHLGALPSHGEDQVCVVVLNSLAVI